jgi:hypothetical protein
LPELLYGKETRVWAVLSRPACHDPQKAPRAQDFTNRQHRTDAVYAIRVGAGPGQQIYAGGPALQPGKWNDYEIQVAGDTYDVRLNGFRTSHFTKNNPARGRRQIGVQTHTGAVRSAQSESGAHKALRFCLAATVFAPE